MSNFKVPVTLIDNIIPIEGADFIELAQIQEYVSVVRKGVFHKDEKVAYIPEASVLPEILIQELGLVGKLSGSQKNRVKAIKLKSTLSQGLILKAKEHWNIGDDVQEELGIIKFEVPIPEHLAGKVANASTSITLKYDIENFKHYPNLIPNGELVSMCEKCHGTFWCATLLPENKYFDRTFKEILIPGSYDRETQIATPPVYGDEKTVCVDFFVGSKGLLAQGLIFVIEENKDNVYVKIAKEYNIKEKMKNCSIIQNYLKEGPVHLCGEVIGFGIQDLGYSISKTESPKLRIFDVYVGLRNQGRFLNDDELDTLIDTLELERVPVLYKGPFSKEVLKEFTSGKEAVTGKGVHIREGVVVRPLIERKAKGFLDFSKTFDRGIKFDGIYDRVQLKSVSSEYLTRKGDQTEYQ